MILAMAVLLFQPVALPQPVTAPEDIKIPAPVIVEPSAPDALADFSLPLAPVRTETLDITSDPAFIAESALPLQPQPVFRAIGLPSSNLHMTVSIEDLRRESRRNNQVWLGLGIAAHTAATFDAYTTRRAISRGYGREINPLLKPFAGNSSLYAAIQVGPALMDLLGKKMMHSRHGWMRKMWWAPQVLSTAASVYGGVHNLRVRPVPGAPAIQ